MRKIEKRNEIKSKIRPYEGGSHEVHIKHLGDRDDYRGNNLIFPNKETLLDESLFFKSAKEMNRYMDEHIESQVVGTSLRVVKADRESVKREPEPVKAEEKPFIRTLDERMIQRVKTYLEQDNLSDIEFRDHLISWGHENLTPLAKDFESGLRDKEFAFYLRKIYTMVNGR